MDKLNHNNQTQTKPEGIFKLIKPRFLILLVFILSALIFTTFSIGLESASGVDEHDPNGYKIYAGDERPFMGPPDSGNEFCQFENTSKVDDYFIPARHLYEWTAVKGVPAGHDLKRGFCCFGDRDYDLEFEICCAVNYSLCYTNHPNSIPVCYDPQNHECCSSNSDYDLPALCDLPHDLCNKGDCIECLYYVGSQTSETSGGSTQCVSIGNGEDPDNGDGPTDPIRLPGRR